MKIYKHSRSMADCGKIFAVKDDEDPMVCPFCDFTVRDHDLITAEEAREAGFSPAGDIDG